MACATFSRSSPPMVATSRSRYCAAEFTDAIIARRLYRPKQAAGAVAWAVLFERHCKYVKTRTQLHAIRERRGIGAAQVAKLAGVSRQTIYAIEAGDYVPNTALALQLARILEARVEDLF